MDERDEQLSKYSIEGLDVGGLEHLHSLLEPYFLFSVFLELHSVVDELLDGELLKLGLVHEAIHC